MKKAERSSAKIFVERYGDRDPGIEAAIRGYSDEVRSHGFPGPDHVYGMKKGVRLVGRNKRSACANALV
ncbi:MAG: hypothetical protein AB7V13_03865 [Pseudorhodoplanes sp.]|uniref:hypothetical protein n=1 Tax=Pseudorhodoplanes sp. TaxID=1934341 RepID=UPI003D0FBD60